MSEENAAIKPRPVTSASIPGLLATLQNEWDALMSEAFTLKTHLDKVGARLYFSWQTQVLQLGGGRLDPPTRMTCVFVVVSLRRLDSSWRMLSINKMQRHV